MQQTVGSQSYVIPGTWPNMVKMGNIDLNSRPTVHNRDGSISTVDSVSFSEAGHEVLIPKVIPHPRTGVPYVADNQSALRHYQATGQHLGVFKNARAADYYAQQLHLSQAKQYVKP